MKSKNIVIIYLSLLFHIVLSTILLIFNYASLNNLLITPLSLATISIISSLILPKKNKKIRYAYEKLQNILIILILYLILYFTLGLIFGYSYSIYNKDLLSLLKNIYMLITPIILEEYIRNKLVIYTKNSIANRIAISLIFSLLNINIVSLYNNITPLSVGFKYVSELIIPTFFGSFIFTYTSESIGVKANIIYRSFLSLIPVILPIVPNLPWIVNSALKIILFATTYFNISSFDMKFDRRERRTYLYKRSTRDSICLAISFIFILFILKFFNYYPVAVLSDSMKPLFSRGYTVIVKKINKNDLDSIKECDIIYYKKDNKYIIHRIKEIKYLDGRKVYITKGDNNKTEDSFLVYDEEIKGIVKLEIPYIGFPAVWFNEALKN